MQRQNTGDHPPSEAALWRVFSTRQISAAKAEKDCIKGKKGTQTVQNDQSLCRQQSECRKKTLSHCSVPEPSQLRAYPGFLTGGCVPGEYWAPSHARPHAGPHSAQCHTGIGRKLLHSAEPECSEAPEVVRGSPRVSPKFSR